MLQVGHTMCKLVVRNNYVTKSVPIHKYLCAIITRIFVNTEQSRNDTYEREK